MPEVSTYLSIDIDFWNIDHLNLGGYWWEVAVDEWNTIVAALVDLRVPLVAVMNHQQMLRDVDCSGADHLMNIDSHSDLSDKGYPFLECGSWVSFVAWRRTGTYAWVHRTATFDGDCSGRELIFRGNHHRTDWNMLDDWHQGRMAPDCLPANIVAAGLCMSPAYSHGRLEEAFRATVKHHAIAYRKGIIAENGCRVMRRAQPANMSAPETPYGLCCSSTARGRGRQRRRQSGKS